MLDALYQRMPSAWIHKSISMTSPVIYRFSLKARRSTWKPASLPAPHNGHNDHQFASRWSRQMSSSRAGDENIFLLPVATTSQWKWFRKDIVGVMKMQTTSTLLQRVVVNKFRVFSIIHEANLLSTTLASLQLTRNESNANEIGKQISSSNPTMWFDVCFFLFVNICIVPLKVPISLHGVFASTLQREWWAAIKPFEEDFRNQCRRSFDRR